MVMRSGAGSSSHALLASLHSLPSDSEEMSGVSIICRRAWWLVVLAAVVRVRLNSNGQIAVANELAELLKLQGDGWMMDDVMMDGRCDDGWSM